MNDHLFDEAVENLADMRGASAVESEGVFVEIGLEVLFLMSKDATKCTCGKNFNARFASLPAEWTLKYLVDAVNNYQ